MFNILGRRYLFFGLSLLLILPGIILAILYGLNLSVDFTGGTLVEIRFESGNAPPLENVVEVYNQYEISDVQVQTTGDNTIIARSSFLEDSTRAKILAAVEEQAGERVTIIRIDSVGATIGQEVTLRAALAVAVAAIIVVIYITFAFRGMPNAFRNGICAIIAELHDVLIIFSLLMIGGILWSWQIDALFLTALLTVIGFSVQDTIVVFDRIRENSTIYRRLPFETLVNHSIIQTLQRSINTQLMTVEFMLLALVLFGGLTLRQFAVILFVGLFSGTYSSIFIAAPVLVVWENREWQTWFGRGKKKKQATV
ncbi:MAG TPA: protein translocase subunit SecF [Anaerolineales bacterium]|nr:protein translocase subunit SecF [Anaerolineales bacterium]